MDRRTFLKLGPKTCVAGALLAGSSSYTRLDAEQLPLKTVAAKAGKMVGMFTTNYQLTKYPEDAKFIARNFSMMADGNDLKMDRLRPAPDRFDFTTGDAALAWAKQNGLLVRGHCLVWGQALPAWFQRYINRANAKDFLTKHIETVVGHYAGQMYSWDVVNEAFRERDGRPDGLRQAPWLNLLGPDYIAYSFRVASASDPKARLILNETHIEHDRPEDHSRRGHVLSLLRNLKAQNIPVHTLGMQSHLAAGVPLARELAGFLSSVEQLGIKVMITELDVDDTQIPDFKRDEVVAETYRQYLETVGRFTDVICFQELTDRLNWLDGPNELRRSDGAEHRPDMLDSSGTPKPAFAAVQDVLTRMSRG